MTIRETVKILKGNLGADLWSSPTDFPYSYVLYVIHFRDMLQIMCTGVKSNYRKHRKCKLLCVIQGQCKTLHDKYCLINLIIILVIDCSFSDFVKNLTGKSFIGKVGFMAG